MADKYAFFAELSQHEIRGRSYEILAIERDSSPVSVIAPHGGAIEHGTSELARAIAGEDYSFYAFEGRKPHGANRDLHITSHRFDEPRCLALVARSSVVLGVHGCVGRYQIWVGGLDSALAQRLTSRLRAAGLPASADGHRYPARNPFNICNRGARGRGAQLEFTSDLRTPVSAPVIARAVRSAIAEHLRSLAQERTAMKP